MTGELFNPEAFEQIPGQISMQAVESTFAGTDGPIVGKRHVRDDGLECLCGCQRVEGLAGEVIEAADVDGERLEIVRFMVPSPAGGPDKPELVAYFDREYRFPVAS